MEELGACIARNSPVGHEPFDPVIGDAMYPCLHCLNTQCVELKNDRKGRPYTTCRMCASRTFMHSSIALRGLTHFAPQLIDLWRQATAAATLRQLDNQIEESRRATPIPANAETGAGS